jgi:hypothetical protein
MTRALLAFVGDQGLWPHRRAGPARLGDQDWARPSEREHDRSLIPIAQMTTLARDGHFLLPRSAARAHRNNHQLGQPLAQVGPRALWGPATRAITAIK